MPDHIHLYVAIPPKNSAAEFVGYLKGKSSLMIFDRHSNLKYRYGNRHFWCRGYYQIKMENSGRVPGSKAVYYKIVDPEGRTVRVYKETYDPDGNLVHVKEK